MASIKTFDGNLLIMDQEIMASSGKDAYFASNA